MTKGGDSAGEAAHRRRRGWRILEAMPGAGGLFIYVEDDGWPGRLLVQRIGVFVRFSYSWSHPFIIDLPLCGACQRSLMAHLLKRRRGPRTAVFAVGGSEGRSLGFLARVGSVLLGAAQAAIGRKNEGGRGSWRCWLSGPQSKWEDGTVRTGSHAERASMSVALRRTGGDRPWLMLIGMPFAKQNLLRN